MAGCRRCRAVRTDRPAIGPLWDARSEEGDAPKEPSWLEQRRRWAEEDPDLPQRWRILSGWMLLLLLAVILWRAVVRG